MEESDDPRQRFDDRRRTQVGQGGGPGAGTGNPRVGFPPYPGGGPGGPNGPYGGGGNGRQQGGDEDYERMQEVIRPAYTQDIALMDTEVDSRDEHSNKLVFYTDGRKIQKSKDEALQQVSAQWKGAQLVTDEKGPQNRKMSRTLELSSDGRQLTETWRIESRHSDMPITVRYVYDAADQYE